MKMTLREANERYVRLAALGDMVFPSKLSFAVSYNIEQLQKEAERAEKERKRLCALYADKDREGEPIMESYLEKGEEKKKYRMGSKEQKDFSEEYGSLMDTEVEVEVRMVPRDVIGQCESSERYSIPSIGALYALDFMMEKE